MTSGRVRAWGINYFGELGDGTTTYRSTPVPVRGLIDVHAVAAGDECSLAVCKDGTVRAWGLNGSGKLGDGTTTNRSSPVQVANLTDVRAVSAGWHHSLAVDNDGRVWAWGSNHDGQLGDGTTSDQPVSVPVRVVGLTEVRAVAAGTTHSLAVRENGTVWGWGSNNVGQLGNGTTSDQPTPIPVQVADLPDVRAVAATCDGAPGILGHSLALCQDGTVRAWGQNRTGQLGDGTTTDRSTPVQVHPLTDVKAVAAGSYHDLALCGDGTVRAWGTNIYGELGYSTDPLKEVGDHTSAHKVQATPTPVQVHGLTDVKAVAAGRHLSLALRKDGKVLGWGHSTQLGLGGTGNDVVPIPTLINDLINIIDLSTGVGHSLALEELVPTADRR